MSSNPAIIRNVVDLPQPDGPTKTINSLSLISRLKSNTAWTLLSYILSICLNDNSAILITSCYLYFLLYKYSRTSNPARPMNSMPRFATLTVFCPTMISPRNTKNKIAMIIFFTALFSIIYHHPSYFTRGECYCDMIAFSIIHICFLFLIGII